MPLTPADVHNVAFSKPPIGKRGYAEDEVDQFLDLVEDTLGQLQDENDVLRAQVEELQAELSSGGSDTRTFVASDTGVDEEALRKRLEAEYARKYEAQLDEAKADADRARHEAEKAREEARKAAESARTGSSQQHHVAGGAEQHAASADTHMQAARVLSLAQEMADRLTNDARTESNTLLDEARAAAEKTINDANETSRRTIGDAQDEAERTLSGANQQSEAMLTEAKRRSETILSEATAQSEATLKQAEEKAAVLRHEADRKYNETMTTMKQQQSVYENRIEELRVFEREYRTRLKNLLETKLNELESHHTSAPHSHGNN